MPRKIPQAQKQIAAELYALQIEFGADEAEAIRKTTDRASVSASTVRRLVAPSEPPAELLTAKEAARRLGVSESQIRRLAKDGALPAVRIGRLVRYRPSDLDDYLGRQRPPSNGPYRLLGRASKRKR